MCYIKTFYPMDLWKTLRVYHKPTGSATATTKI